ncbi:MAG: AbrB/MazE/SpoVT family DNA-binding domain-containing protein [Chlamydiales bacterium]
MVKSTVTSKGQVTIPKEIRTMAMIHEGTQIDFQLQEDGKIVIIPIQRHISQLKGILKTKRKKPVSLAEMKKAISDGALESMK